MYSLLLKRFLKHYLFINRTDIFILTFYNKTKNYDNFEEVINFEISELRHYFITNLHNLNFFSIK